MTMSWVNKWGEEVLSEYVEYVISTYGTTYDNSKTIWQLHRIPENDYERREYGREFVLVRYNATRSQSFRAGEFTRETARALRDMLDKALKD